MTKNIEKYSKDSNFQFVSNFETLNKNVCIRLNLDFYDVYTYSLGLLCADGGCLCVHRLKDLQCFELQKKDKINVSSL